MNDNFLSLYFIKKNMTSRIIIVFCLLFISASAFSQLESKKAANGKFGFTNDEEWVIQPMYDEVMEFYDYSYAFVKVKGKWGLIDQQGKTVLPFEYSKVLEEEYLFGDEENRTIIKNGKYGIVNRALGKMLVECIYEKPFGFTDGIFPLLGNLSVVYRNNKAGLLNEKGVEIVPCIFDGGKEPFKDMYLDLYVLAKQNNKSGVVDTVGNLAVPCVYDEIKTTEDFDLLDVVKNKKHGLFSLTARKEIIAPLYDEPIRFDEEYAYVRLNKKYGAIDKDGNIIVPFKYANDDEVYLELEKLQKKE